MHRFDDTARAAGRRSPGRVAAVGIALAIGLVAVPGTAAAAPDADQLAAAQQAADAAAAQVGEVLARQGAAREAVDTAQAQATAARARWQETVAGAQRARTAAGTAGAAAQQAEAELATARAGLAAFARESYMSGSTDLVLQALITSAGPGDLIERAALL